MQRVKPSSEKEKLSLPFIRSSRSRFGIRYSGIFSRQERKHIFAACALVTLVGISMTGPNSFTALGVLILVPGFLLSFLGHELAHKFLARRNGLWAEYRTNVYGLMLTAISVVFPFFKFLAPGQTNIQGNGSRDVLGAISLIGPGFNIVLGALFFAVSRIIPVFVGDALATLSSFNGWLAIINLIPFGSMDGTLVFTWDKTRWAIAIAASVGLVVAGFLF